MGLIQLILGHLTALQYNNVATCITRGGCSRLRKLDISLNIHVKTQNLRSKKEKKNGKEGETNNFSELAFFDRVRWT